MTDENKEEENKAAKEEQFENSQAQPDEKIEVARKDYEDICAKLQELEALKDNLQRTAADFENAKKRLTKEREDFIKFSQENLIKSLLPILDNFQRALAHVNDRDLRGEAAGSTEIEKFKKIISGVEMVYKQFQNAMKNQGLVEVESVNQTFDPHKHEALAYVEEQGPEDQIVDVIESGYMLNDRLIRAAKVRVRVAPKDATDHQEDKASDF